MNRGRGRGRPPKSSWRFEGPQQFTGPALSGPPKPFTGSTVGGPPKPFTGSTVGGPPQPFAAPELPVQYKRLPFPERPSQDEYQVPPQPQPEEDFNSEDDVAFKNKMNADYVETEIEKDIEMEAVAETDAEPGESPLPKQNGEKKRSWKRVGPDGKIIKYNKTEMKNFRIKKLVQPKNSITCLNEIYKNPVYNTEQEIPEPTPQYTISVEVNGQKYYGYGSTKNAAKSSAAEAALMSFLKPANPDGKDETPWCSIASFAVHQLFNNWQQSFGGTSQSDSEAPGISEMLSANPQKVVPKPAKELPSNAATLQPMNLLHMMHPSIAIDVQSSMKDKAPYFHVSAVVNDQKFVGEGTSIKKAKLMMAKEAVEELYNIKSEYNPPNN